MSEEKVGLSSFWFASDSGARELECYEAKPIRVIWHCGRCDVAMNDFDMNGYVRCAKGHLNRRP